MQGKIRAEWTEAISYIQEHDFYGNFTICEHHFKIEDFCEENGKRCLRKGVIPSVFSCSRSHEICSWSSCGLNNINLDEIIEYGDGSNEPALKSLKENDIVCKQCIDLNLQLMKANKTISSLKKKVSAQKKEINEKKKEVTRIQNEDNHLKTKGEV